MKILHTSNWHLGRALYGRKRYDEYEAFLNWLAGIDVFQIVKKMTISITVVTHNI